MFLGVAAFAWECRERPLRPECLPEIGVTQIVVPATGRNAATLQDEVIFETFAHVYGRERQHFSDLAVFPMPTTPPPAEAPYLVLVVGMAGYPDELYRVDALTRCDQLPPNMRREGTPSGPGRPPSRSDRQAGFASSCAEGELKT